VSDVEAETLLNTMHHSLAEVKAETPLDTLRDVETEASADMLANSLTEVKGEKVGETRRDVKGAPLV